jgi:hypothetical protein
MAQKDRFFAGEEGAQKVLADYAEAEAAGTAKPKMRSFADASPEVKRIVGDRYVYHSKWFANTRTVNRLELFHVESSLIFSRQAARKVSTEETATHVGCTLLAGLTLTARRLRAATMVGRSCEPRTVCSGSRLNQTQNGSSRTRRFVYDASIRFFCAALVVFPSRFPPPPPLQ